MTVSILPQISCGCHVRKNMKKKQMRKSGAKATVIVQTAGERDEMREIALRNERRELGIVLGSGITRFLAQVTELMLEADQLWRGTW